MPEEMIGTRDAPEFVARIKQALISNEYTLILGLSSSLTAGAAYSYLVSVHNVYFTPALGVLAGFVGGIGIAARDLLSEKKNFENIPLKDLTIYVVFGITGLFLGYIFIYYFIQLPTYHGGLLVPSKLETIYEFFADYMGILDIGGAILGSICSVAIPIIFKEKVKSLMERLKIKHFTDS